jgi:hypothetical protein
MKHPLLLLFFLLHLLGNRCFGQIDTEFWFVAPEITNQHADLPIYLYVSSFDQPGTITITQPANTAFGTLVRSISANSTVKIDLTPYLEDLENLPPDQILSKGLLIQSTVPVTSYYEVFGSNSWAAGTNSDLFSLKGNHALGTRFYIPFQTHWDNNPLINAWASFDMVATEDNTSITITPSQDIVGHLANIPFTIVLNRGETYSAQAISTAATARPAGSLVTSTKPIAITTKDDSMYESGSYDTAGDQLIPTNILGEKYIVTAVSSSGNDRVYILASENNTEVFIDGNALPITTLNAGQQYELQLLNPTAHIVSSHPVYVFHVTGFSSELGGALLPPLNCTGSKQVSVTRSTNEDFFLILICETGAENSFTLNNNATIIPGGSFQDVNGSGGTYKFLKLGLDYTSYPEGSNMIIKNTTGNFHLGTCNGASSTGFRYGYFSDYGFLELGNDKKICVGDSIQISSNSFLDSYTWYKTPSATPISTDYYITAKDSGTYWVEATKGACEFSDTIKLNFHPEVQFPILGNDTAACSNIKLTVETKQEFFSYLWSNGQKKSFIEPKTSGKYWIEVRNEFGCKNSDTILITRYPIPMPVISYNVNKPVYCKDSIVSLASSNFHDTYLWSNGETSSSAEFTHNQVSGNDLFWLQVSNEYGCFNRDTLKVDCSTEIGMIPNLLIANGDGLNELFFIDALKNGRWSLAIYNRWGDKVYWNEHYENNWDANGLDEGVYFFNLVHNDYNLEKKGWIHLMRNVK